MAVAVREDSEQRNAHHGEAWHQVRAPGWAAKGHYQINLIDRIRKM